MLRSPIKPSPLMQMICLLLLANSTIIGICAYSLSTGRWTVNTPGTISLLLSIWMLLALLRLRQMTLTRINAIAGAAQHIMTTGDLSRRIVTAEGSKDLNHLSGVLNGMLDTIEHSMQAVRTASDSIAHDLRHPLTRLRNQIEDLFRNADPDQCPEERNKLADLVAECDKLLGTFQAILRISNIEATRRHSGFRDLSLTELMQDIAEMYEPVATDKDITLLVDALPTRVIGDKDLLFQAFTNLVDNAIKYTPEGGSISIQVQPTEKGGCITITDTGHGISDEHKPHVFRRFYRVDSCRTTPGAGLGLALVQAIIALHKGTITLTDTVPNGLSVTVNL